MLPVNTDNISFAIISWNKLPSDQWHGLMEHYVVSVADVTPGFGYQLRQLVPADETTLIVHDVMVRETVYHLYQLYMYIHVMYVYSATGTFIIFDVKIMYTILESSEFKRNHHVHCTCIKFLFTYFHVLFYLLFPFNMSYVCFSLLHHVA